MNAEIKPAPYVRLAAARFEEAIDRAIENLQLPENSRSMLELASKLLAEADPFPSVILSAKVLLHVAQSHAPDPAPIKPVVEALDSLQNAFKVHAATIRFPTLDSSKVQ